MRKPGKTGFLNIYILQKKAIHIFNQLKRMASFAFIHPVTRSQRVNWPDANCKQQAASSIHSKPVTGQKSRERQSY